MTGLKKQKLIYIITFALLCLLTVFNFSKYIKNEKNVVALQTTNREKCLSKEFEIESQYCQDLINKDISFGSAYYMFSDAFILGIGIYTYVIILICIVFSSTYASNYVKSGAIKNEIVRTSYKDIMFNIYKKSIDHIFLLPLIIVIAYAFCFIHYKGIGPLNVDSVSWQAKTMANPILFILLYIINVLIHLNLYTNISLIWVRKFKNIFLSIVCSFLTIIGIEIFFESAIFYFIYLVFKKSYGSIFNIINFLAFNDVYGMFSSSIVPLILLIISYIILYLVYKDKEKFIKYSERDEK